ncbi:hypothetical protein ACTG23_21670 [Aeromonas enteropelogenes]|uniref:hypothetical protein n=1 Tax=Aeromonas enteropelogenes TaxID=29489 RepID=UPI003F7B1B5B
MNIQDFMTHPEDFFRGNGDFFVVDRDWGGHNHYLSIKYLFLHVASGELILDDIELGFYKFLLSLKKEKGDLVNFFASAVYIYSEMDRSGFKINNCVVDFFWPEKRCYLAAQDYLSKIDFYFGDEHYVEVIKDKYPKSGLGIILNDM